MPKSTSNSSGQVARLASSCAGTGRARLTARMRAPQMFHRSGDRAWCHTSSWLLCTRQRWSPSAPRVAERARVQTLARQPARPDPSTKRELARKPARPDPSTKESSLSDRTMISSPPGRCRTRLSLVTPSANERRTVRSSGIGPCAAAAPRSKEKDLRESQDQCALNPRLARRTPAR